MRLPSLNVMDQARPTRRLAHSVSHLVPAWSSSSSAEWSAESSVLLPVPCHRHQIHGEQYTWLGQFVDTNDGAGWPMFTHLCRISLIHLLEVLHIFEKDRHVQHMLQIGAHGGEHDSERLQDL